MNFDYTEEQKQFAESVRRFALNHLAAGALKRAHDPRFPYDVAQLMAKQGGLGSKS
jgi:alkylation response protein AidB-like acyl-CoA dehydrogenase